MTHTSCSTGPQWLASPISARSSGSKHDLSAATTYQAHGTFLEIYHSGDEPLSVTDYSPIARALCMQDAYTGIKMTHRFEIAYTICKEG